jgi:S1-C subfamily serine protease
MAHSADFSIIRQYSRVLLLVEPVPDKPDKSRIRGSGSAIVIAPTYAVTVAHNLPTDPQQEPVMISDGVGHSVKVLKVDPITDIALVTSPDIKCPCAPLVTSIERDEEAWTVGFPKFSVYQTQFVTMGILQGMLNGRIVASPNAAPGSSGGGMFVKRGTDFQLAGLVVAIGNTPIGPPQLGMGQETQWITFSVSAATIKLFLKGTPAEMK